MILAELEVFHSRPIAPTRRVALGRHDLPVSPAPGFGGILLGGIVAHHIDRIDPDLIDDLQRLTLQLQEGHRVTQPRLRHRLQVDRVGLTRSRHRLVEAGDSVEFDLDDKGSALQQVLGAVYAAGELPATPRRTVMDAVRKGIRWYGGSDAALVAHLAGLRNGRSLQGPYHDPVGWALEVLGMQRGGNGTATAPPARPEIQRRFREQLRVAHPDHGGATDAAAQRIADLTEARRILLT